MPTPEATRAEVRVSLPWPSRVLSPNARSHWAVKAAAVKGHRTYAWAATLDEIGRTKPGWESAELHWEFHPKTKHPVDDDNIQAACKAYRDGIAGALGIDDSKFTTTYSMGAPVKGGAVLVTLREG